jgi:superfamily II DNA or RNA helicase
MAEQLTGKDLFIVDNSISGWTGVRYLREWCGIATSFDIATGFFEIGALLELDNEWQKLEKIRILMGDEVSRPTKQALLEAVRRRAAVRLDASLEEEKHENPFLGGVNAIVQALEAGRIECRIYNKEKFHAKAYITRARLEVIGAQALVGSSNFTRPGLTQNIELNIQVQSGREVAQLQSWFDQHWSEAKDVTPELLQVITRHTAEHTPFEVYAKALHEFFRGHELTAGEWDETQSQVYPQLDLYQKEAYGSLMKIARQYGGAFLCDGVGLGKTFVGLMLIERLVLHENKRVVLFAPKGAKESVWEPHLRDRLPHIGGIGGGSDFSNLAVFSHTDLDRKGDFPERFARITQLADAVIIDEAHHFRNPGRAGDSVTDDRRSRYRRLYDLLGGDRQKTLYMLTATPINNQLSDFRHMAELFTRREETYFARTLGVNSLTAHFNAMDKALQLSLGGDPAAQQEGLLEEAHDVLAGDVIFRSLVVQRSRAYARASQIQETGAATVFPERRSPQVAEYSVKKSYGQVLELFEKAFEKKNPLFSLPMYYPLAYYIGPDDSVDPREENRQRQVVGLIRTQFLKRFESSVYAFERSLDTLLRKLLAFAQVHSQSDAEKSRLDRWMRQHAAVIGYHPDAQLALWPEEGEEGEEDEDIVPPELLEGVTHLPPDEYNVSEMLQESLLDLDQIAMFLEHTQQFTPAQDDKAQKLVRLLKSKDLDDRKVLIFTEFADTARYLERQLSDAGILGVSQIDSATKTDRTEVIKRFSPYYNRSSTGELATQGKSEIRVLISTDLLSEGLNLQDATRLINYDIHWNPVRLMQRIGRVDRRLDPTIEVRLTKDHPDLTNDRGHVAFWNFLPPGELNDILSLYKRVTQKTLLISKTFGIEGRKLLTPQDNYEALREFNAAYEGTKSTVEDMRLEYQALLKEDENLVARLEALPGSVFSGRKRPSRGMRGVFLCYALPAFDHDLGNFTLEAGPTSWFLCDAESGEIFDAPGDILESIRSKPDTPRRCVTGADALKDARDKVLKHIKNTYLKRLDVPLDAPKPALRCWIELNEG